MIRRLLRWARYVAAHAATRERRREVRAVSARLASGAPGALPRPTYLCSSCGIHRARFVARNAVPYFAHLCAKCYLDCSTLERAHYVEVH